MGMGNEILILFLFVMKDMVIEIGFMILMLEGGDGGEVVENMKIMTGIGINIGEGQGKREG